MSTKLKIKLAFLILITCPQLFYSEKYVLESVCLQKNPQNEIKNINCQDSSKSLIVSLVKYTNDYLNQCSKENNLNSTKSLKSLTMCSAYPTQELANICNGKQECNINLESKEFQYGFDGSNCDFEAETVSVSYQCIPNSMNHISIPKYDICSGRIVDHPLIGFIHSPNYPNSYDSSQFCQLTLQMNDQLKRIEIFLIDLETEGLSKRHFNPTDYLQINNKEKLYGKKSFTLIYNDTIDATIVFRSDLFFNQRGFVLYFEAIKKPDPVIEFTEETYQTETTTIKSMLFTNQSQIIINQTELYNESLIYTNFTENMNTTNSSNLVDGSKIEPEKYVFVGETPKIDTISTNLNELTTKTIISLVVLIIVLTSVIIFLITMNRKAFFSNSVKYLDPYLIANNSHLNDTSLVNGYLESNNLALNKSIVLATSSSNIGNALNVIDKKKMSDDSVKLVLIKNSISEINGKSGSPEAYAEIFNTKQNAKDSHSSKVNEYCYIQASGLVSGCPEATFYMEHANNESKKTGSHSDLSLSKFESALTSTPSAPKTLPPSKDIGIDQQETDNDYQKLNKTGIKNVYRSCFDESNSDEALAEESTQTIFKTIIEVEKTLVDSETDDKNAINNENEPNDYQIPLNVSFSD